MDLSQISIFGIFTGTVIGMLLGAFWYSPVAFGPLWMKSIGKTPETLDGQTPALLGSIIASILTATGVAILLCAIAPQSLGDAIGLGSLLGLLIIFPALLSDNLFCAWGIKLLLIQSGYRVLSVVLMSAAIFYSSISI